MEQTSRPEVSQISPERGLFEEQYHPELDIFSGALKHNHEDNLASEDDDDDGLSTPQRLDSEARARNDSFGEQS